MAMFLAIALPALAEAGGLIAFGTCTIEILPNRETAEACACGYTVSDVHIERNDKEWHKAYFSFAIHSDSWVYLGGRYSGDLSGGLQTHVDVYADKEMTKEIGEYGWGFWEYDNSFEAELKKGTYYACISYRYANYDGFDGNIDILAGRVPTGKVMEASVKYKKDKRSATVTVENLLGEPAEEMLYRIGKVTKADIASADVWQKAGKITVKEDDGTFLVKRNGTYSVRMKDGYGNYYMKKVKVSGLKE